MKLEDFNYKLPNELIAQSPASPRDHSRLLVLNREDGKIVHDKFFNLSNYLKSGDILVFNNSKVIPARLIGHKEFTGGKVEILLNQIKDNGIWEVVGKNLRIGNRIKFDNSKMEAIVISKKDDCYFIQFSFFGERFFKEIEKIGEIPIPPYIAKARENSSEKCSLDDKKNYQTVYAKTSGSVAAPTAGLHFTADLIKKLKSKDVQIEYLTLHVGLGTFMPVKSEEIENHKIHKEYFSIERNILNKIKKEKGRNRIIAVGTTTCRVLEHLFSLNDLDSNSKTISGMTDIYIYPPYKFKSVDALITNFHLPKSSLLILVSAFAGSENIKKAYSEAIKNNYRFYSYGDAMLIE